MTTVGASRRGGGGGSWLEKRKKVGHPMKCTEECPTKIPEGMEFCARCGFHDKGDETCLARHYGLLLLVTVVVVVVGILIYVLIIFF